MLNNHVSKIENLVFLRPRCNWTGRKDLISSFSFKRLCIWNMLYFCTWKCCGFASFPLLALTSGALTTFLWGVAWLPVLEGSWEVAQPCRSRADCWRVLAHVLLRAWPSPSAPGLPSPADQPLSGCPRQAGTQHQGLPACNSQAHGGRAPGKASQNVFFLQPGPWLHYSKADHEQRQPNLQGGGGAGEAGEPISAVRTLTSLTV